MDSRFDAAWKRASPAIDRHYGTLFLYQPMCRPAAGGRSVADPTRPAQTVVAALTETASFVYPETRSRRGSVVAQEAAQSMTIDIADSALPYATATGDRLVALDAATLQPTGAVYEINGPQPDGIARTDLRVFKLSAA